jgi:hypothetical protein
MEAFSALLAQLVKSGEMDVYTQQNLLAEHKLGADQYQQRKNYLDQLYGGDVLGVQFDQLPTLAQYVNEVGIGSPQSPTSSYGTGGQGGTGGGGFLPQPGSSTTVYPEGTGPGAGSYQIGPGGVISNWQYHKDQYRQGATTAQQGIKDEEGQGRNIRNLMGDDATGDPGFWGFFGMRARPTYDYRVVDGQMQWRPKKGQTDRIEAGGGERKWENVPANQQKAYEKMQAFREANPGASAGTFLADKGLQQALSKETYRGDMQQVGGDNQNPIWFSPGTGLYYNKNGQQVSFNGSTVESGPYTVGGINGTTYTPPAGVDVSSPYDGSPMADRATGPSGQAGKVGSGGFHMLANAYNPTNNRSWGLLAAPASQIAGGYDDLEKQIMESMPAGGERDRAIAEARQAKFAGVAGLKQNLVNDATRYISSGTIPTAASYTGAAGTGVGGINQQGSNINQANAIANQYDLGLRGIDAGIDQAGSNLWGSVFGALGTLGSAAIFASDIRVKEDIKEHEPGLLELAKLKTYDWTYNGKGDSTKGVKMSGVMAQELEKIIPEAVTKRKTKDLDDMRMVDYSSLLATTINAVQDLDKKVKKLERTH